MGVTPHLEIQFKSYTWNEFAFARSYIFWGVMLGHRVNGSQCFKGS